MKVKNNLLAAFILTALTVFVACEKNVISMPGDVPVGAKVKFVHACSNCPSLLVTANNVTINPTAMSYGTATTTTGSFPTSGYAILPTGDVTLDFIRSDSSKSLISSKVNLTDGKWYTIYIGDTIPTPTISLIEDDIKPFQDTLLRIRFANLLSGKTKDTLELVHQNYNKVIATNVTYGKASEFTLVPNPVSDTFYFRKVGATTAYPLTGLYTLAGFKAQTYTFFTRGLNNKTTGVQLGRMDLIRNR